MRYRWTAAITNDQEHFLRKNIWPALAHDPRSVQPASDRPKHAANAPRVWWHRSGRKLLRRKLAVHTAQDSQNRQRSPLRLQNTGGVSLYSGDFLLGMCLKKIGCIVSNFSNSRLFRKTIITWIVERRFAPTEQSFLISVSSCFHFCTGTCWNAAYDLNSISLQDQCNRNILIKCQVEWSKILFWCCRFKLLKETWRFPT